MVHSDLFQQTIGHPLSWPEHIYLQAHFNLLCQSPLRENCLDLWNNGAIDDTT